MKKQFKMSVSSADTYKKCPKKYYWTYVDKLPVEKVEWIHSVFGSCAHKILELFHQKYIASPFGEDDYLSIMKDSWNEAFASVKVIKYTVKEDGEDIQLLTSEFSSDTGKTIVDNIMLNKDVNLFDLKKDQQIKLYALEFDPDHFEQEIWSEEGDMNAMELLQKLLKKYIKKIKTEGFPNVLATEQKYEFRVNDVLVHGIIDRIDLVSPGHYEVVDYKTTKSIKYLSPFQLLVYAIYVKSKYPDAKKISGRYILLKHGCKDAAYTFTDDEIEKTIQDIKNLGIEITTDTEWIKKPTPLCSYCDFEVHCQDKWMEDSNE